MSKARLAELVFIIALIAVVGQWYSGREPLTTPAPKETSQPNKPPKPMSISIAPSGVDAWQWHTDRAKAIYDKGYALEGTGRKKEAYALYAQAQPHYEEALQLATDLRSPRRERSLENLRWILVSQQLYTEEEAYTRELVEYWRFKHDPEDPVMLAQAHYQLARNLHRQKKFEESIDSFELACQLRDRSLSGPSWVYYDNFARVCKDAGDAAKSKALKVKASEIKASEG